MITKAYPVKALIALLVVLIGIILGGFAFITATGAIKPASPPSPHYSQNASGETYGSLMDATVPGTEPDLVRAMGVDGKTIGYVRYTDLTHVDSLTSEEASVGKRIPLYKEDGKTVIGEYEVLPDNVRSEPSGN